MKKTLVLGCCVVSLMACESKSTTPKAVKPVDAGVDTAVAAADAGEPDASTESVEKAQHREKLKAAGVSANLHRKLEEAHEKSIGISLTAHGYVPPKSAPVVGSVKREAKGVRFIAGGKTLFTMTPSARECGADKLHRWRYDLAFLPEDIHRIEVKPAWWAFDPGKAYLRLGKRDVTAWVWDDSANCWKAESVFELQEYADPDELSFPMDNGSGPTKRATLDLFGSDVLKASPKEIRLTSKGRKPLVFKPRFKASCVWFEGDKQDDRITILAHFTNDAVDNYCPNDVNVTSERFYRLWQNGRLVDDRHTYADGGSEYGTAIRNQFVIRPYGDFEFVFNGRYEIRSYVDKVPKAIDAECKKKTTSERDRQAPHGASSNAHQAEWKLYLGGKLLQSGKASVQHAMYECFGAL